ncbi:MAG TPA: aldo/keto reductase [Cyclobacteriaceae bacterium]|nr:aldo/keto reductase [Cyclobacteriaceae bacterium]
MQHLPIHPSGPTFSRIIAGAWRWNSIPSSTIEELINTSLDEGITTFDHADIYGDYSNEKSFGDVIARQPHLVKKMQLVTKCGIKLTSGKKPEHRVKHYDTSKEHIIKSAENSLSFLHTDHIDLLLIHRPDILMDVEEVADAFSQLKLQGKVLHFGVSNFTTSQFELLQSALSFPLVTNQVELSLFCTAPLFDGTIEQLYRLKASAMAWSPLGGGRTFVAEDEVSRRIREKVNEFSSKYNNATTTQFFLAWLLKHPSKIFPVIGTSKPERLREAAKAIDLKLDTQDWYEMLKAVRGSDVA